MQVNTHLNFDGNCREAFEYYEKLFGGKVTLMLTYGESPVAEHVPPVDHGKILHATFEIDPFRKFCLTEGLDDIGLTLRHAAELDTFEKQHDNANWLKPRAATISA